MEKKYQVFVSSTYIDLSEERKEVIQALLELDCIPVGMELFPAADDDQWTLIKRLIDDCDYYILIVGGRYGSVSESGLSYTQMEYEYALEKEIPIISFLPKNPEKIAAGKTEKDPGLLEKLNSFKNLVQQKMCRFWESPLDLGSQVSRSLIRLIKDKPRDGWVKASYLPSEDLTNEILSLKNENELLKQELKNAVNNIPEGAEDLSQGDDKLKIKFQFLGTGKNYNVEPYTQYYEGFVEITWNKLFATISPLMIDEVNEIVLKKKVSEFIANEGIEAVKEDMDKANRKASQITMYDDDFQTIKIQFRALNMITESIKKRGVHDKNKYWTLTPFGDSIMTRLRAIKR